MKALWKRGLRYRKHVKGLTGTPDIVFAGKKVAIFCDSEFWHGKDWTIRKNDFKSIKNFGMRKFKGTLKKIRK